MFSNDKTVHNYNHIRSVQFIPPNVDGHEHVYNIVTSSLHVPPLAQG